MRAYPLAWPDGWPRNSKARKVGLFGKQEFSEVFGQQKRALSIEDGVRRIRAELMAFGIDTANDLVISTNLKLNLSGMPRGDQGNPSDPGVAIYWQKPPAPMRVMAIDAYKRVADNLAAVAATLNAMRAIERHGGAQILERAFTGFLALPPPKNWRDVLALPKDFIPTRQVILETYRALALVRHPDRMNGSEAAMAELNIARDAALKEIA